MSPVGHQIVRKQSHQIVSVFLPYPLPPTSRQNWIRLKLDRVLNFQYLQCSVLAFLFKTSIACIYAYMHIVASIVSLWTVARQAPLSMGFSRQEYWNGFPCPPPRDLPNPGIKTWVFFISCIVGYFCLFVCFVFYH